MKTATNVAKLTTMGIAIGLTCWHGREEVFNCEFGQCLELRDDLVGNVGHLIKDQEEESAIDSSVMLNPLRAMKNLAPSLAHQRSAACLASVSYTHLTLPTICSV